ncbi:MAG: response regulator [Oligoflexales bacterium]|nr:response regulator [Oligoflexales bacterium]
MKRILIVDDSVTSRMFLKRCLQTITAKNPCEIIEAENGEEALSILDGELKIDILMTDINMPTMSGYTLVKNIQGKPNLSGLPIIFVTSLANESGSPVLLAMGVKAVIKKPVKPQEVLKAIEPYLDETK